MLYSGKQKKVKSQLNSYCTLMTLHFIKTVVNESCCGIRRQVNIYTNSKQKKQLERQGKIGIS